MLAFRLLIAGVMLGTLYGLVAVTLTLMLRSTGILSFAHAAFALISAYTYGGFVCPKDNVGYRPCGEAILHPIPAAALGILFAVVASLLVERFVARPLSHAAPATKMIATAAVLGLTGGVLLQIFGAAPRQIPIEPARQILPRGNFEVAGVVIPRQNLAIFLISIGLVVLLGVVLRRSWFGLGVRAAGQLADVSRLMGVKPVAVSRFNWALGGFLAGLAGVLIGPLTVVNAGTFSFLLVRAVGATLIGGLVSLPLTFAGGILIGGVEAIVPHFWRTAGARDVAVAALIVAMLIVYGKKFQSLGFAGGSYEPQAPGRLMTGFARWLYAVRELAAKVPRLVWVAAGAGLLMLPFRSSYHASVGVIALYYCLVALSVVVITGTTGQVTFMQAGFVAIGAFGLATGVQRGWNMLVVLAVVTAACAAIGALVGLVSLRFRGIEFAIASLALSAVLSEFVVTRPGFKSNLSAPSIFGRSLLEAKNLFGVMLVVTALAMFLVANVRRSAWGRALTTMREMHTRVGHFGVPPVRSEVALLALSAGLAGLAGAFFALTVSSLDPFLFVPLISVIVVLAAVVGGLRSLWGPVLTAAVFGPGQEIVGRIFSRESANAFPQIASALLAIVILVAMPNGLASLFAWARDVVARTPATKRETAFRGKAMPALALMAASGNGNGNGNGNGTSALGHTENIGRQK
jgi:sulfate-transporting ATPase